MANVANFSAYVHKTGNILNGVAVSDNLIVGVSTLNQLEQYGLIRPTVVENATIKAMKGDKRLAGAFVVRDQVQRRFDKARVKRADAYSYYIDGIGNGSLNGGAPPITLFCPLAGDITDTGVMLPYGVAIVNIDGETQTEARFLRRERNPATGDEVFPFMLYHGISTIHAGNIMHDMNRFAHPVAEKVVASLNSNGSLTKTVNAALSAANIDLSKVNRHSANVKAKHVTSFGRLIAGALGVATGANALKRGGIPRLTAQYNSGSSVIDSNACQPFLVAALNMANGNKLVGKAPDVVWALAGAVYAESNRILTIAEFQSAANVYLNTRGAGKIEAAAKAINYGGL